MAVEEDLTALGIWVGQERDAPVDSKIGFDLKSPLPRFPEHVFLAPGASLEDFYFPLERTKRQLEKELPEVRGGPLSVSFIEDLSTSFGLPMRSLVKLWKLTPDFMRKLPDYDPDKFNGHWGEGTDAPDPEAREESESPKLEESSADEESESDDEELEAAWARQVPPRARTVRL
jgi:hypothetical protein